MSSPAPALSLDATTIQIEGEITVRAPIEVTFAALLDQLGPYNDGALDKPMPMKLESWPGGRWIGTWAITTAITGEVSRRSSSRRFWKYPGRCLCPVQCYLIFSID